MTEGMERECKLDLPFLPSILDAQICDKVSMLRLGNSTTNNSAYLELQEVCNMESKTALAMDRG